jgi:hypothetical protein
MTVSVDSWLLEILAIAKGLSDANGQDSSAMHGNQANLICAEVAQRVFVDLDSYKVRWKMRQCFASHPALVEALELFLHGLYRADIRLHAQQTISGADGLEVRQANDRAFHQCAEWSDLQDQASELIFVARQYGHRAA